MALPFLQQKESLLAPGSVQGPQPLPAAPAPAVDEFAGFEEATPAEVAAVDEFAGFEEATPDELAALGIENPNEFAGFEEASPIEYLPDEDLSDSEKFNITEFFRNNKADVLQDPAKRARLREISRARRIRGVDLGKVVAKAIPEVPGLIGSVAKGFRDYAARAIEAGIQPTVNLVAGAITNPSQIKSIIAETKKNQRQAVAEMAAGSELATTGLVDLARTGVRKLSHSAEDWAKASEEEIFAALQDDVDFLNATEAARAGKGIAVKALGLDADTLAKDGIQIDPDVVESLSLADPIQIIVPVKGAQLLGKLAKVAAVSSGVVMVNKAGQVIGVAPNVAKALEIGKKIGTPIVDLTKAAPGTAVKVAGKAAEVGGKALEKLGEAGRGPLKVAAGIAGAVKGAELGGIAGAGVGAVASAAAAGRVATGIVKTGQAAQRAGQRIIAFGRELTGELPPGRLLKTVQTIAAPVAPVAKGAAVGAAVAAPLAAAADTNEQAAQLLAGGLALGGLGGAAVGTIKGITSLRERVVGGRLLDPFDRSTPAVVIESPDYGLVPALDDVHRTEFSKLDQEAQATVNGFRELFRGDGEIYLQDGANYRQRVLEIMETEKGAPLTAEEIAAGEAFANTHAVFSSQFNTAQGPKKVVFLNEDSTGLPHDAGHLFEAILDEPTRDALRQEVLNRYTPEELQAFKTVYEDRLNQGAPAGQPRRELSQDGLVSEIIAENFSGLMANAPVETLGTPRPLVDRMIQAVARVAEKAGIDLTGGRATPNLPVKPSFGVQGMLENAVRERISRVEPTPAEAVVPTVQFPEPQAPPQPGAPTPAPAPVRPQAPLAERLRNIRVTPPEQAGTAVAPLESARIDVARTFAAKLGDPKLSKVVEDLAAGFERKPGQVTPVELEVLGAKEFEPGKPTGRLARLEERIAADAAEAAGSAPQDVRQLFQKGFVPVRFETVGAGAKQKLEILGMSLDKVLANVNIVNKAVAAKGIANLLPYEVVNGRFTETAWRRLQKDLVAYTENQQNGFRGDGRPLVRPAPELGASIPPENPNYRPTLLPEEVGNYLNLLQGLAPPKTSRVTGPGVPGNVKARRIAELNLRSVETPAQIAPGAAGKQTFPSGETVGEVNPLRNELSRQGVEIRDLHEVTERLRVDRIKSVKPRPELQFKAPFTDVVRAGFLPRELEQRRIVTAALRTPRGEIITARTHPDAFIKGLDEGTILDTDTLDDGFVDGAGNFLSRDEAFQRAVEIKQVQEADLTGGLVSQKLESKEFRESAKFLPDERDKALRTGLLLDKKPARYAPIQEARNVALEYAREAGIDYQPTDVNSKLPAELGMEFADLWESATHNPTDAETLAGYQAFKDEIRGQYRAIERAGVKVEPFRGEGEPYKNSSEMVADVRDNKHLYFLQTEKEMGGNGGKPLDHTLLEDSGIQINGESFPINDLFRVVHDYFGHAKEGYQFGPQGEFNAWRAHSEMFSPEAQGALASESIAQTAWTNYGPHARKPDGTLFQKGEEGFLPLNKRPFARQKVYLVPNELIKRARETALEGAKFLPAELTDATANKFVEDVSKMPPEEFMEFSKTLPSGITGKAVELGKLSRTPEAVKRLQELQEESSATSKEALKAGDFDAAMTLATKTQFFREAVETATMTGSMGKALTERGADFLVPPPAKFLPRTTKGVELEQAGYEFKHLGFPGTRSVQILKGDEVAGVIYSHQPSPELAVVDNVLVDPKLRKQGLGEALYRELGAMLQEDGVKRLSGFVVAEGPLQIRKSVFGDFISLEDPMGEPLTPEAATEQLRAARATDTQLRRRDVAKPLDYVEPVNRIDPEAQFLPKDEADKLKDSLSKFPNNPEAENLAALKKLDLPKADIGDSGWVLTDGTFLSVEKGEKIYHDDFVEKYEQFTGADVGGSVEGFQDSTGSMRISVQESLRQLGDYGDGSAGISFTKQPTRNQIAVVRKMLDEESESRDLTPMFKYFDVDILNPDGTVRVAKSFEIRGAPDRAKLLSFLQKPFGEGQFLPRKKTEEKLPLVAKSFILPNGKFQTVDRATHDQYLIDNATALNKQFKAAIPAVQGKEDVRVGALAAGFVRVSYEPNNGRLVFEGNVNKFGKPQRDTIQEYVTDNLDSIDNLTVSLVDNEGNVKKSASRRFFQMDDDAEKLNSIPFVTEEGAGAGPKFLPAEETFSDPEFPVQLRQISKGEKEGETFNSDGSIFSPGDRDLDVVTMASVDIPAKDLTLEKVREALAPFAELLDNQAVKPGLFRIARKGTEGEQLVSVDVNAIVDQAHRDNTLEFSRNNNQEAVFDLKKFEVVPTGGDGNTVLKTPAELVSAVEKLVAGEPVEFPKKISDVEPQPETAFLPKDKQRDFDLAVARAGKKVLSKRERSELSPAELRKQYPEAVVPRSYDDKVDYSITESPLYKKFDVEEEAVEAFADRLEKKYNQHKDNPITQLGQRWYDDFTPLLKARYGEDAPIFAELLAATSPNTTPKVNYQFAEAAFKRWKNGDFDQLISKYEEGLEKLATGKLEAQYKREVKAADRPQNITEPALMAWWIKKHDLLPKQVERMTKEGPKSVKFGMHSEAVLKVITRRWLNQTQGPKTQNFVRNLLGESDQATIDLWAARTMREAGYKGFQDRWRILPQNSKGVSDADFSFSQKAFEAAAKRVGLKASQLQGALWFIEKMEWARKGWSELSLGDFKQELKDLELKEAQQELF